MEGMWGLGREESRVLPSLSFEDAGAHRSGSALGFLSLECLGAGRRYKRMVTAVMLGLWVKISGPYRLALQVNRVESSSHPIGEHAAPGDLKIPGGHTATRPGPGFIPTASSQMQLTEVCDQ